MSKSKDKIISTASTSKNNSKETSPLSPITNKTDFFDSNSFSSQSNEENLEYTNILIDLISRDQKDQVISFCSKNLRIEKSDYFQSIVKALIYISENQYFSNIYKFKELYSEIELQLEINDKDTSSIEHLLPLFIDIDEM